MSKRHEKKVVTAKELIRRRTTEREERRRDVNTVQREGEERVTIPKEDAIKELEMFQEALIMGLHQLKMLEKRRGINMMEYL